MNTTNDTNTITITRPGYPTVTISRAEFAWILDAADRDRPSEFLPNENDCGSQLMRLVGRAYDRKHGWILQKERAGIETKT